MQCCVRHAITAVDVRDFSLHLELFFFFLCLYSVASGAPNFTATRC